MAKTVAPTPGMWGGILGVVPLLMFAFNFTAIGFLFQLTGRWYVIIGGTLYAAGKFPFLACSESINKATFFHTNYSLVKLHMCVDFTSFF